PRTWTFSSTSVPSWATSSSVRPERCPPDKPYSHPFPDLCLGQSLVSFRVLWSVLCEVPAVAEVVAALVRGEGVQGFPEEVPQPVDRPLAGLAQQPLQLGEGQLDRVEVRAVRRQVHQPAPGRLDRLTHPHPLLAGEGGH